MEEDAQKRNTDCVYFLASPLTCKKGKKCEFRHSEAARMNPRDCWYWIHSTCRNPNCSFRHPPLEGKPSSAPSQSSTTTSLVPSTTMPAAALASKSKTHCYFFSKAQPKPPKENQIEPEILASKPVVVLQSFATNISKPSMPQNLDREVPTKNESQHVFSKVTVQASNENPRISNHIETAKKRVDTLSPYRGEDIAGSGKPKICLFSDRPNEFPNSTERRQTTMEERRGPSERKQQQQSQYEHEHSHALQGGNQSLQNGNKVTGRWKNDSSSLDGEGSDQSLQREDGEYSSHLKIRGRDKDQEGRVSKGSQSYGRDRFDSVPAQHRQVHHTVQREQLMQQESDHNGKTDHTRHHRITTSNMLSSRDGQRLVVQGHMSNVDLREHLMKRRRIDRGNHQTTDILSDEGPHMNQWVDEKLVQDHRGRVSSRGLEHRGTKRLHHDGGVSPDGRSSRNSPIRSAGPGRNSDRGLTGVLPAVDYSRAASRERGRDRYVSRISTASEGSHLSTSSKSLKVENTKEDTGFMGPKSLAQIKAERDAKVNFRSAQRQSQTVKQCDLRLNQVGSRLSMPGKLRDTSTSTSSFKRLNSGNYSDGREERKSDSSEDFEGPKSLSELLKQKQKLESDVNLQVDTTGSRKAEDMIMDENREMEDGELRDEEDEWRNGVSPDSHSPTSHSPIPSLQKEIVPGSESDINAGDRLEDDHSQELVDSHDDVIYSEDEAKLDFDQTMSGEEDYELYDEDDDDFAKKLGGIYS
ncbi:hypothetical protein KP509_21G028800 [Ceratopteris richardii]|uniref:C3H1-type domain-containing protein n=1 Tax=Ceratopteris richardii TaxID=49495 RepID=A0A8T2S8G5_CERRI|nr:hypothetical protein KP509_21G028800 [Ceratopteris richardii]